MWYLKDGTPTCSDSWVSWRERVRDVYGADVLPALEMAMDDLVGNETCVDNFRVCEVGDELNEAEYEKVRYRGCCGSADTEVAIRSAGPLGFFGQKRLFRIGMNYGH